MYKTIGMVAHVDAGKTTLLEQLLYNTKTIRQAGRVDTQNTFLDYHSIEKERGITVFSDQAMLTFNASTYYLIDTPGHVDFSTEMERAVRILDAAVIILSSVEGIEGHTETVWQLLRKYHVPTFFFVNKLDRAGADFEGVVKEVRDSFTSDLCILSKPVFTTPSSSVELLLKREDIHPSILEFVAERDDLIMEKYLEEEPIPSSRLLNTMRDLFKQGKLFPCLCGSTLHNVGVLELMHMIDLFTVTNYNSNADFMGTVHKIRYDDDGNKITFIKALQGELHVKDTVVHLIDEEEIPEKINQIRIYNGMKYTTSDHIVAGQLAAVTGLNNSYIGEAIGNLEDFHGFELIPALKSKVVYEESMNPREVLKTLQILTEEDPSLGVVWEEVLKEIHIHVMGLIQLEVLQYVIKERFGLFVAFEVPQVLYKETIVESTKGFGHFEPLKHYAEVELQITPAPRNSGIYFSNHCSVDILDTRWQRMIEKNIPDGTKRGILTGSPLTDLHITLLAGKSHNKHTHGGDFRQATFRCIRQGIEKVENILLEPYYAFKIKVEQDLSGRIMADILKMYGQFDAPVSLGEKVLITGTVPVATSMEYPSELASFSQGKGSISLVFNGYERCHNEQEVIERMGYDKNKDPEYTSNSIFCSHGKGFTVAGKDL